MIELVEKLRTHLETGGLIPSGARVLVGYSGGADSTFLLHALHRCGVDVAAGHLHHGQRPEADDEMFRCEAFAKSIGVPFVGGRARVPVMAKSLKIGLEEAGRKARYEFLQKAADKHRCDLIATAHTRDDHVESVLLNLVRGSGMSGLTGIPSRRDNIVRPALPFSRDETRAYCLDEKLWFHDDPANSDPSFSRTRIRLNVMPELRRINPAVDEAVARMAEILSEEENFLNGMAAAALEQSEVPLNGHLRFLTEDCEVAFDRIKLASVPAALVRRALRLATGAVGGALDYVQTVALVDGFRSGKSGSVTSEGGHTVVEWNSNTVVVREVLPAGPARIPLHMPGETEAEGFGWRFTVQTVDAADFGKDRRDLSVVFDSAALEGELHVRAAGPGDLLVPLGMTGRKKLTDIFGEAGLSHAARRRLPIVCDMIGPVWVPGLCMSDRAKVTGATKQAIELRFGPQSPVDASFGAT